jgi:3-hydroxyacyl-CoA dehydrogenase / enoyl-CoA hydratase / 3-hydroxybutyryl-CoA epimerase
MAIFQSDTVVVEKDDDGSLVLRFDVPDHGLNVITRGLLADLDAAFDAVSAQGRVPVLALRSGKKSGFLAGADLNEFAKVSSSAEATAISEAGQKLFDKLAGLPAPTVAVIHGPCLGGGLEMALACDYRLVFDHPKTQLGLPEVMLGLIPGWGGTQRLPRVVGLERALQIFLAGKRLDAREAFQWGLSDAYAGGEADLRDQYARLLMRAVAQGKRPLEGLPRRTWRQRLLESNPLGRRLVFKATERVLRAKVPDDMPAPGEALEAVRVGVKQGMAAGLAYEREAAGRLALTPACRNLVTLFFQREHARQLPPEARDVPEVKRVGVVGAGVMGAGIAQLAAVNGAEVVVQEVNQQALSAGMGKIDELFRKAVERRVLTPEEGRKKRSAVRGTLNWEGFDDLDVVVEAAVEDPEVKRNLFRAMDTRARPSTVLATNTSSLTVARLQDGLAHPERVAGLHFFNPVHKMPLVEVVRAPGTADRAIHLLTRWAIDLGKTPVVVGDSPGFVVNRVLMPYLNEAVLLVAEGLKVKDVDRVMRRFGMPVGPLELLDQVGLDIAAHVAQTIQPALGGRFEPNPAFERLKAQDWLGVKNGTGFYVHSGKAPKVNRAAEALLRGEAGGVLARALSPEARLAQARERMVLLMVNEAALALGEGVAADAETVDLAMVMGTGWAPHRGGPLRYADDRGPADVVQMLNALAGQYGRRFEPCAELRRRAGAGERFRKV